MDIKYGQNVVLGKMSSWAYCPCWAKCHLGHKFFGKIVFWAICHIGHKVLGQNVFWHFENLGILTFNLIKHNECTAFAAS